MTELSSAEGRAEEAQAFADIARALQSDGTAQQIVQRIVDLAPQLIARCEHAGITMVVNGQVETPAASGPVPIAVDRIQYEANQGPCLDAMRKHAVFVTDDLASETRWPDFAARAAAETGVRSMLSFRLFIDQDTFGSLNLYSAITGAFDATAAATGGVFAAHAAIALASARERDRSHRLSGELASGERNLATSERNLATSERSLATSVYSLANSERSLATSQRNLATSELSSHALREEAAIAAVLQLSMLTVLPTVRGLDLAACYYPAVAARQVGGDWYDTFVLPDETVALVIGDVAGHDIDAAVRMAQLRNMLRALAIDRRGPPSEILHRLDQTITELSVTDTATCIYALLDRRPDLPSANGAGAAPWRLRFANAGHPPPLLITRDAATYLETADHLLVGLGGDDHRSDAVLDLPAQATLLLYTDGLVEPRGRSIEDGLARLQHLAASLAEHPIDKLCDTLVAELAPNALDDVCLLAVRTPR